MLKDIFSSLAIFILGILGGIFGAQVLWPIFVETPFFYRYNFPSSPVYINKTQKIYIEENTALVDAIERVKVAVVGIETRTKRGKLLDGSGLILTSDGLVVTLAQLLPKRSESSFYFEGKKIKYQLLKRDVKKDLALIQLKGDNFPTVGFAEPKKAKLGKRIFLAGVTFEEGNPAYFASQGIIRYLGKEELKTNIIEKKAVGSALFDIKGNVFGLNYIDKKGEVRTILVSILRKFANL